MDRRDFLILLSAAAAATPLATLLAGCGDDGSGSAGGGGAEGPGADIAQARSDLARITTDRAPGTAGEAVNAFAADLYDLLVMNAPHDNLVFSPASIAIALAMTAAGAQGMNLDEMLTVLHAGDADAVAEFHRSMNGLLAGLEAADRTAVGPMGDDITVELRLANSLWCQQSTPFRQPFLDLLATEYGAGANLVDYQGDLEGTRQTINAWVADATRDHVPELLKQGILTPNTVLTLVNAVFLKAPWETPFDQQPTGDAPFTTAPGDAVTVPMMRAVIDTPYGTGPDWVAVDLPYALGDLHLTVVLADGELPTPAEVDAALSRMLVDVGLPRFDIESAVELNEILKTLGMPLAFDGGDFSSMSSGEPLYIGHVVHGATMTLDEHGTEAAAATAVVMITEAGLPEPAATAVFDRPFTFWLRERSTDAILFMGRVTDPSQTRG